MKCYYHNDNDGKCAAAIVRTVHPTIKCVPINYNIRFPIETIHEGEVIYIVDFSLSVEDMEALLAKAIYVVWIDHHRSAIEKFAGHECLEVVQGIREIGKAGCVLTWEYLKDENVPRAVKLIGDYDTRTFAFGQESNEFYFGSMCSNVDPNSAFWPLVFSNWNNEVDDVLNKGRVVMQYRKNWSLDYVKNFGVEISFEGHRAICVNVGAMGSQVFGEKFKEYDLGVAYVIDPKGIAIVSLYSEKIDAGRIAEKFRGGGHKGAAGFTMSADDFIRQFIWRPDAD